MTKAEFLDTLRRRLAGLPPSEIDELISDYAAHFADGMAAGRSEAEIAAALGDPMRLARELRAEAGFRRWESARTPANFFAVLFGFLALMAVDFIFLLPLLGGLALFTILVGFALLGLSLAGIVTLIRALSWDHVLTGHFLSRTFGGIGLLGFGIGGSALLLLMIDYVVRLLGKYARLHYALLNRAEIGGAHG
jgi:uncharacterized membrane protein